MGGAARRIEGSDEPFRALLAEPGVSEVLELRGRFGFMAFHGGELEAVTDVVASRAAAASGSSYYGVLHPEGLDVHLPSALVAPSASTTLERFLAHLDVVVAVHGYGRQGMWTSLLAGGTNRALAAHVAEHVACALPGYEVMTDLEAIPDGLRGLHPDNPVNLPVGGGVQLELPPRVRGRSPLSPPPGPDGLSAPTRALIDGLAAAARSWPPHDPATAASHA